MENLMKQKKKAQEKQREINSGNWRNINITYEGLKKQETHSNREEKDNKQQKQNKKKKWCLHLGICGMIWSEIQ